MKRRFIAIFIGAVVGATVAAGCGGGGGGGGDETTPTPSPSASATPPAAPTVVPRVAINWGERSRATGGLNSALSAVVRLQGASPDGSDLTFTVNRVAATTGYTVSVNAPRVARVGRWFFSVAFFAQPDGGGGQVGLAQATVDLTADGALPDVSAAATITQVELAAGQQVGVGQQKDLAWTARSASGDLVAVTPGSGFFAITSGMERLRVRDGQVEGLLPGQAQVVVRVDGATSAATPVQVTSDAVVSIAPSPVAVSIGGMVNFAAQVSGAPNQAVTWSVEGAGSGSITADGRYTAPSAAGVYTVRATSVYDPSKSATVSVTVQDGSISVGGEFPPSGGIGVDID